MGTMQPIREKEDIIRMKNYFIQRGEYRNYTLLVVGLNLPLRISDILNIHWSDVYNEKVQNYNRHVVVTEKKTNKKNRMLLNRNVIEALDFLRLHMNSFNIKEYIFMSPVNYNYPLSRVSVYLIIKKAAQELGLEDIGCHSLRKTFGYHAWKQGIPLAVIMELYNHSSISITKRYLGIEQDDLDEALKRMVL